MKKLYLLCFNRNPVGFSGESVGSEYNLGCENCGAPIDLKASLFVKGKFTRPFYETLDGDYLISDELYKHLRHKQLKFTEELKEVSSRNGNPLPYFHLWSSVTLPRLRYEVNPNLSVEPKLVCPICNRSGYFNTLHQEGFVYDDLPKDVLAKSDIFLTWEYFGLYNRVPTSLRKIKYARPQIVVSERFKDVVEDFSVKEICFENVTYTLAE